MSDGVDPPPPTANRLLDDAFDRLRIPPLAQRVALGVLIFLGVYIAVVGLPVYAFQLLAYHGFPVNLSQTALMYYGGAMAALSGAQYAAKPSRAYGPVAMGTNVTELLYLWLLYQASPLTLTLGGSSGGNIALGYTVVILALMLVAVLSLAAYAVLTYEDFSHPAERLYWTYHLRRPAPG